MRDTPLFFLQNDVIYRTAFRFALLKVKYLNSQFCHAFYLPLLKRRRVKTMTGTKQKVL